MHTAEPNSGANTRAIHCSIPLSDDNSQYYTLAIPQYGADEEVGVGGMVSI
jgi:hypothetical protein